MINTDYVKLYEALLLIQKICKDSTCYSCPLADGRTHRCRITGGQSLEEGFSETQPSAWKLICEIQMFRSE